MLAGWVHGVAFRHMRNQGHMGVSIAGSQALPGPQAGSGDSNADLLHAVDPDAGAIDLDLVRVHGGVGDQDVRVLDALRLPHADALVQDEALIQEGFLQGGV